MLLMNYIIPPSTREYPVFVVCGLMLPINYYFLFNTYFATNASNKDSEKFYKTIIVNVDE